MTNLEHDVDDHDHLGCEATAHFPAELTAAALPVGAVAASGPVDVGPRMVAEPMDALYATDLLTPDGDFADHATPAAVVAALSSVSSPDGADELHPDCEKCPPPDHRGRFLLAWGCPVHDRTPSPEGVEPDPTTGWCVAHGAQWDHDARRCVVGTAPHVGAECRRLSPARAAATEGGA